MKKNMGAADRLIRTTIAIVVAGLYFTHRISGTLAIVLMVVAVALFLTSAMGWCPAYLPFGLSTRKSGGGEEPK